MKKSLIHCVTLASAAGLLTACMSSPYPIKEKFILEANKQTAVTATPTTQTLMVVPTIANAPYNENEFVYQLSHHQYRNDFYHVFFTAPTSQIYQTLIASLQQSGLFQAVHNAQLQLPYQLELRSQLLKLAANYTDTQHPTADITLDTILTQQEKILFHQTYAVSIPLAEKSTQALVHAWDEGLSDILHRLNSDLYQYFFPQAVTTTAVAPIASTTEPSESKSTAFLRLQ